MKIGRLTKSEKKIEDALLRGEYKPVSPEEFARIARAIERRKKTAVLNIRISQFDLDSLKLKAKRLNVPYQTLIGELLHQFAA